MRNKLAEVMITVAVELIATSDWREKYQAAEVLDITVLRSSESGRLWGVSIDKQGGAEYVQATELVDA